MQDANGRIDSEHRPAASPPAHSATCSRSIDWYAEGEARVVEVAGVRISVRLIGRKGRRARIAIAAPAGAVFRTPDAGAAE